MTIKRCSGCGKPFSNKSKYSGFCSEQCKRKYFNLLNAMEYSESQIEHDLRLKKEGDKNFQKRNERR